MNTETMNIIITSVLIPFLVALVALFVQFTSAKAAELKTRLHNEEISKYVTIAEDAVVTAVGAVSQVIVDTLKDMAVDGQLTDAEKEEAFTEARNRALLIMGIAGKAAVTELYGSFDSWIDNKIQYYVRLQKPQEPVINVVALPVAPVEATTAAITEAAKFITEL